MANQTGIEFEGEVDPGWPTEPKIEIIEWIARDKLDINPRETCEVKFFANGSFSKIYKIEAKGCCCLMKVTRPIDPTNTTKSEVATSEFVRNRTNIPVSVVYAWEASSDNVLGFEWILMDMIQGEKLGTVWRKLPLIRKEELARTLASYQAQIYRLKLEGIGNLQANLLESGSQSRVKNVAHVNSHMTCEDGKILGIELIMDRIVPAVFDEATSINLGVQQGPFTNSKDWILSLLTIVVILGEKETKELKNKEEIEEKQDIIATAKMLVEALPRFFPKEDSTERTCLAHEDLSLENIFVDDFGQVTGITGWGSVSALPLWKACQFPELFDLIDQSCSEVLSQDESGRKSTEKNTAGSGDEGTEAGISDYEEEEPNEEGKSHVYWEDSMEYECTKMRQVFIKEMAKLEPDWLAYLNTSKVKYDFYLATVWLLERQSTSAIRKWLDAFDDGMVTTLCSHLPKDAS